MPAGCASRSGSSSSKAGELGHRGRLAAGDDQPVDPVELRGRRTATGAGLGAACSRRRPAGRDADVGCSRTSPCRARTPTTGGPSPATCDVMARLTSRGRRAGAARDVVDVDADHGLAEAAGDLGDDVGVVVEGGGLDDRGGALGRVAGLEDARADEHALGAELHHHRGVGRGGDAAGGEQHDRAACRSRRPRRPARTGACSSLAATYSSSSSQRGQPA